MPKVIPRGVSDEYFEQAMGLDPGEELFIPCIHKKDSVAQQKEYERVKLQTSRNHPIEADSVRIYTTFRDGKNWLVLHKMEDQNVAYVKGKGGVKKIQVEFNPERERVIKLMVKDGCSLDEAEEALGDLTLMEKKKFRF